LPTQAPLVQTPLAQSVLTLQVPPPGLPLEQAPWRHNPLAQSALAVQTLPPILPGAPVAAVSELLHPKSTATARIHPPSS
jgi:hypothetical protein